MNADRNSKGTIEWTSREGEVSLLRVRGAFDEDVVKKIESTVSGLESRSPLVVNLRDVVYLSSAGIGELVHLASRFHLVLAEPPETVVKVLGLAEVLSLLEVAESEEEALSLSRQEC
ncbi:MAG: STAS domain-containing protein [Planctomycetota bacterium]|jgi:anti-anti-sigma factor